MLIFKSNFKSKAEFTPEVETQRNGGHFRLAVLSTILTGTTQCTPSWPAHACAAIFPASGLFCARAASDGYQARPEFIQRDARKSAKFSKSSSHLQNEITKILESSQHSQKESCVGEGRHPRATPKSKDDVMPDKGLLTKTLR